MAILVPSSEVDVVHTLATFAYYMDYVVIVEVHSDRLAFFTVSLSSLAWFWAHGSTDHV